MKKNAQKKCQRILKRQALSDRYPDLPWRIRCGITDWEHLSEPIEPYKSKTKYLVDGQEVSETEFNQKVIELRPCEQILAWIQARIAGTVNGTTLQIVY